MRLRTEFIHQQQLKERSQLGLVDGQRVGAVPGDVDHGEDEVEAITAEEHLLALAVLGGQEHGGGTEGT